MVAWLTLVLVDEAGFVAEVGVVDAVARGVPDGVALGVLDGLCTCWPSAARPTAMPVFVPVVSGGNRVLLAGTSLRNEAKIWLSSGCVHRTLAVLPGSSSLGTVKKAILLDGMPRSDCPRL